MEPLDFLAAVLPPPGNGRYCVAELTKKKEHVYVDTLEEAQVAVERWKKANLDVYFGLSTYGDHAVDSGFGERGGNHPSPDRQIGSGDHHDFSHTAIMARSGNARSGQPSEAARALSGPSLRWWMIYPPTPSPAANPTGILATLPSPACPFLETSPSCSRNKVPLAGMPRVNSRFRLRPTVATKETSIRLNAFV